jgi:hypothetical protein
MADGTLSFNAGFSGGREHRTGFGCAAHAKGPVVPTVGSAII